MDILYIAFLIVGLLIGSLLTLYLLRRNSPGTLRVDRSDEDGPYLFLELTADPSTIEKRKQVVLTVKSESFISRR